MKDTISWKKIGIAIFVLIVLAFSSHIFIGISEKYNSSAGWSSHKGYITTFFSYFFITLLIGVIIYAGIKACYSFKWLKNGFLIIATLLLFSASIIIGYSNDHLSRDYERCQNNFNMVDKVLKKGIFKDILDDAVIFSEELCAPSEMTGVIFWQSNYVWRDIVYVKTQRKMQIHDDINNLQEELEKNPKRDIYYISFRNSTKNQDMLLVLSKINRESINLNEGKKMFSYATSNESKAYYYVSQKDSVFEFFIPHCTEISAISLDNTEFTTISEINAR
jgi:hypothetical protein